MGYAGLGTELAGGIAGFVLLGWWIGRQFGREKLGLTIGATIGCVGGMMNFLRRAIEMSKRQTAGKTVAGKPPAGTPAGRETRDDDRPHEPDAG